MTRLLTAAAKLAAFAALLFAGSSCTTGSSFTVRDTGGGPWPGWKDIDEGGFEEMGWILWPDSAAITSTTAAAYNGKNVMAYSTKNVLWGPGGPVVDYEFYRKRTGLSVFCPFNSYVRLSIGDHDVNRIVLDQAAASGGMVHISGRQHSGLRPGAAYVQVARATPIKPAKRIAW